MISWNYDTEYCPSCKKETSIVFNQINGKCLCRICSTAFIPEKRVRDATRQELISEFINKLKTIVGERMPNGKIEWCNGYIVDELIKEYEKKLNALHKKPKN